ncbi:hypothetical protein VTL71DRAFT_2181 [Oculimacula yallundae]|uniref:Uncharacterized protein n=1 Tax=Oculimacula yallundae TaxID=86028 RepID=A0ABR4C869_9HELO
MSEQGSPSTSITVTKNVPEVFKPEMSKPTTEATSSSSSSDSTTSQDQLKPTSTPIASTTPVSQHHMIPPHMIKLHTKIQAAKANLSILPTPRLFTPIRTNPTAHLSILRNPTKCYADKNSPAFSPGIGNGSDAFNRLIARGYLAARRTIEASSNQYCVVVPEPDDAEGKRRARARAEHCRNAKKEKSRAEKEYKQWVCEYLHAKKVIEEVQIETSFWNELPGAEAVEWDESGKAVKYSSGPGPELLGEMVEREMQMGGRSLTELVGLKRAVEMAQREEWEKEERERQAEREERERWEAMDELREKVDHDNASESEEDEDEDEDYHLYDGVPASGKLYEEESSVEDIASTKYDDEVYYLQVRTRFVPGMLETILEEEEDETSSCISRVPALEDDIHSNYSDSDVDAELTALQIAHNNLKAYNTILCNALIKTKREALATARANIEAPIAAAAAKKEKRTAGDAHQNLLHSITRLRLRMAGDGLVSDASGLNYTVSNSNDVGPGSVSFVGRIAALITKDKRVLDRAFKNTCQDKEILEFQKRDSMAACKVSLEQFWDVWHMRKNQRKKGTAYDTLHKLANETQASEHKEEAEVIRKLVWEALYWARWVDATVERIQQKRLKALQEADGGDVSGGEGSGK